MMRFFLVLMTVALFGAARLPMEHSISATHRELHLRAVDFNLGLREQLGQLGFVAALSGFRSLVADALFVQAHVAWERTEWAASSFFSGKSRRCNRARFFSGT